MRRYGRILKMLVGISYDKKTKKQSLYYRRVHEKIIR